MVQLSDRSLDEHLVDAAGQPSQPSVRPAPKDEGPRAVDGEGRRAVG